MDVRTLALVVLVGVFFLAMIMSSSFTTRLLIVMVAVLGVLVAFKSNMLEPGSMTVSEESSYKTVTIDEGFKEDVWECGNCLTIEIEQVFDEKKPFPACPRCGSTSRGRSDKHVYSVFLLVDGGRELMYKYFTYSK